MGSDNWYDGSWKYRRRISFNNQYNGSVSHFPVLIKLEHNVNFDYRKAQDNGNDIRFTDSDGTTLLPHDIEKWDQLGTSFIWAKVPTIDASSNSDYIYIYYGNPTAEDARNPGQVFDNKFVGVWHLNEAPKNGQKYSDATNNHNDATWTNALKDVDTHSQRVEAMVAGGVDQTLNPDGALLYVNDSNFPSGNSQRTISGWMYALPNRGVVEIIEYGGGGGSGSSMILKQDQAQGCVCTAFNGHSWGDTNMRTGWAYLAVVIPNGSTTTNQAQVYVNGSRIVESTIAGSTRTLNTVLGGTNQSGLLGYGTATDEIRISNVARDPSWIKAEYATVTDELQSYGDEEQFDGELNSSIFDVGKGTSFGYLNYTADEPTDTNIKIKARTGNSRYLTDALEFVICNPLTNKADISTNNCVHDGDRYLQYQILLQTTNRLKTPIFENISITDYLPQTTKPVVKGVSTVNQAPTGAWPSPAPRPSPARNASHSDAGRPSLNPSGIG